eukprot:COSAG06_NODE_357_length_16856_cov_7.212687_1_plen_76_part_10
MNETLAPAMDRVFLALRREVVTSAACAAAARLDSESAALQACRALSVLVARGRARVSVSASAADWPKRIRDMQYVD